MARGFPFIFSLVFTFTLCCVLTGAETVRKSSLANIFVDDVVVESTLAIRRKPGTGSRLGRGRQLGDGVIAGGGGGAGVDGSQVLTLKRNRRQNRFPNKFPGQGNFGQGQYAGGFPGFEPLHGGASAAQAQAQGFQVGGPLGSFGASSAGAGSQGFSYGPQGLSGNAGLSGSQSYNLPNGQTLALSYANGFSVGPDGKPTITKGNSIAFTGPRKPVATPPPPPPPQEEVEEDY